jgi:hypothetical protein
VLGLHLACSIQGGPEALSDGALGVRKGAPVVLAPVGAATILAPARQSSAGTSDGNPTPTDSESGMQQGAAQGRCQVL